jgi:MarR family transcriptional regulator for hemolysin
VSDDDIAACLRVFGVLEERLGRPAQAPQSQQSPQEGRR